MNNKDSNLFSDGLDANSQRAMSAGEAAVSKSRFRKGASRVHLGTNPTSEQSAWL